MQTNTPPPALFNDIARCTGDRDVEGEVVTCPVRDQCLRYTERTKFRGKVYCFTMMRASEISENGCRVMVRDKQKIDVTKNQET